MGSAVRALGFGDNEGKGRWEDSMSPVLGRKGRRDRNEQSKSREVRKEKENPRARHGAEACSSTFTLAVGPAGASLSEADICLPSRLCTHWMTCSESSFGITRIRTRDAYKTQWHV